MFNWLTSWQKRTKPLFTDRRIAARHPFTPRMNDRVHVSVGHSSWPTIVRDISTTGIGLVCGMRHEPGTIIPVELFCATGRFSRTVHAEVVRTIRQPDGYWLTGLAFREPLEEHDLQQIL